MTGKGNPGRAPGKEYYYYYVCPHNPSSPRDAQQHPAHVRAAIRERVIHAAVDDIISGLMSADRRAMLAAVLPAEQDLGLIDELPYAAAALRNAPDNVKAMLYAAFDIQVLFRAPRNRPPSGQPSPAPHPASSPAW
jgi:hypothetical protein